MMYHDSAQIFARFGEPSVLTLTHPSEAGEYRALGGTRVLVRTEVLG
jgi:hypothetical protein